MPRNPRKKIVGKAEDVERAERERKLAKLEHELHEEWQQRSPEPTADEAAADPPADEPEDD